MAYIYKIINDINQKIYIGKTEFSIEKRFKEHCIDAFKDRNEKRPLYAAMRKYGIEHFHIEQIEETNNPEEREIYWINYYNSYHNGYNATYGGDGSKKIDYNIVIQTYLKLQNIKQTAKQLNICIDSVRHILLQNNIPIKTSSEVCKKLLGKSVNMLSKTNQYLKTFNTIRDAAKYLIINNYSQGKEGTISTHISEVCKGKRKSAFGFYWEYNN